MTLIIALGNPQRGDDGAAAALCRMVGPGSWTSVETMELTPEMAETVAQSGRVIIADADYREGPPVLQTMDAADPSPAPLTHALRPGDLIAAARRLYGFQGQAWLLRIPGVDFGLGHPLSETTRANLTAAAGLIEDLLRADHPPRVD